jgi:membrane protease YdiL (CAAX protease family)
MTESGGLSRGQLRLIVALVMIGLIVAVAMQNWEDIGIQILFVRVSMSKFLLIVSAFAAGVVVGWLTRKRRRG